MDESAHKAGGWLNSLRHTGDSLLRLAQSRFELFAVELQEEKLRALNVVVWLVVALVLGAIGLLVGLGALALYLWDIASYLGQIGLALAALAAAVGILWGIRRRIRSGPIPFAETIGEFRKDRECLRSEL
jgi:uncharacterized membrane protein YqjE